MKKNYIKPCTVTITVMQNPLLTVSNPDTINMGGSKGTYSNDMGQASRGASDWDDED